MHGRPIKEIPRNGFAKYLTGFLAGITTAGMLAATAATLTITTDAGQDARLAPAFGAKLGLGRNANAAEVKADVINYVRSVVTEYEFAQERAAISIAAFNPA